jgi:hypothetical protein
LNKLCFLPGAFGYIDTLFTPLTRYDEDGYTIPSGNFFHPSKMGDTKAVFILLFNYFDSSILEKVNVTTEVCQILKKKDFEFYKKGDGIYQNIRPPIVENCQIWKPPHLEFGHLLINSKHPWVDKVYLHVREDQLLTVYYRKFKDEQADMPFLDAYNESLLLHVEDLIPPEQLTSAFPLAKMGTNNTGKFIELPYLVRDTHVNAPEWLIADFYDTILDITRRNSVNNPYTLHDAELINQRNRKAKPGIEFTVKNMWGLDDYEVVGIVSWDGNHYTFSDKRGLFDDNIIKNGYDPKNSALLIMQRTTSRSVSAAAKGGNGKTNDESLDADVVVPAAVVTQRPTSDVDWIQNATLL